MNEFGELYIIFNLKNEKFNLYAYIIIFSFYKNFMFEIEKKFPKLKLVILSVTQCLLYK